MGLRKGGGDSRRFGGRKEVPYEHARSFLAARYSVKRGFGWGVFASNPGEAGGVRAESYICISKAGAEEKNRAGEA